MLPSPVSQPPRVPKAPRSGLECSSSCGCLAVLLTLGMFSMEQAGKDKTLTLADRLAPGLEKVKAKAGERKIVVVSLPPQGGEQESWRFSPWLRDQTADVLTSKEASAVISAEVEAVLAKEGRTGGLLKTDLANFLKLSSADLLLQVNYARLGPKRAVYFLLVDAKNQVLLRETISLGKDDTELAVHLPALNRKVVEYAQTKKGQKIGDGECWTLAAEALRAAEAHVPVEPMLYVFGKELGPRDAVFPGDIIQLEKARFESKMKKPLEFSHHTAIVLEVMGPDTVKMIQQNFGETDKTVSLLPLNLKELTKGTMQIYRPQPKAAVKKD